MNNPFINARQRAESSTDSHQELNQNWWETLPMTYAEWHAADRKARTVEDFLAIENYVYQTGPFFREEYDFSTQYGRKILDIGSGSGVFSCLFASQGGKVFSIDLTDAAVKMTKMNARLRNLKVHVLRGNAESLPLSSNVFDYVFSWGVLHHTRSMEAAVAEAGRVLKTGGQGLIMVYHRQSIVYYIHGLYWLLFKGKLFQGHNLQTVQNFYTDGYFHRYLSRAELRWMLNDAGLEVTKIFATQYEKKILPWIPNFIDRQLKAWFGMCVVAEFRKLESDEI
jgi:ubiquinone/menaquinone biosynthesis C-methylase UbiE